MRVAILISLAAVAQLTACTQSAPAKPTTDDEKALYSLGVILSSNIQTFNFTDAELAMVTAGLADGAKDEAMFKPEEMDAFIPKLQELQRTRAEAALAEEKKVGAEHLEKAAAEAGAEKTASGMVYKMVTEGSGPSPSAEDNVKVHYEGKLVNGKVFDSSKERGEPVTFPLNQVIGCWTEGVQKMKVGGTAQLVCPPDLAYGDRGNPPQMPGGATLIFDVELLEIVKEDPAAAAAE
jgi:FKBP-type peptidyl-prolyl cis-trans isomerase